MAERWTDDRMDDLKGQVEGIDRRMEQGFGEVRKEIGGLRSDLGHQVGGLRGDLERQVGGLRGDLERQVGGLRGDLEGQVGGLRGDLEGQVGGLRGEIRDLRDHMDKRLDTLVYAILGFGASMFAAMMGLIAAVILSL